MIQFKRGTTASTAAYIGAVGEVTVDTDKKTLVVHDGVTPGGSPQQTEAQGLQSSGETFVSTSAPLTAAVAGGTVIFSAASAIAPVLPAASALPAGGRIQFFNVNTGIATLTRAGADIIAVSNATVSTLALGLGDTLTLESNGANGWNAVAGSVQLGSSAAFGASLAGNGYQKLPSGLIIQWGSIQFTSGSTQIWTLPISFPNAVIGAWGNYQNDTATGVAMNAWDGGGRTLSTIKFQGPAGAYNADVFAIGR